MIEVEKNQKMQDLAGSVDENELKDVKKKLD
jgi:hypothetical protein